MSVSSILPMGLGLAYWVVLPRWTGSGVREREREGRIREREREEERDEDMEGDGRKIGEEEEEGRETERQGLLSPHPSDSSATDKKQPWTRTLRRNLRRSRGLFFP